MQARLKFTTDDQRARAQNMVGGDVDRVFNADELASGKVMVAATGITSGDLVRGVRFRREYALTESIVMQSSNGVIRRIETIHQDV
jgi:fructose-1,6-bisphosphatase/sedoheptulose 1,7-bisphosphatase-like protein